MTTRSPVRGPWGRTPPDPDAVAVDDGDRCTSFAELAATAHAVGHSLLDRGLRGRVVGLPATRSAGFVARLIGAWDAGVVPALVGDVGDERARRALAAAGAVARLGPGGPEPLLAGPATGPVDVGAAGHVLFTSGTTGTPKGVVVGRAAFEAASAAFFDRLPMDTTDRVAFLGRPGHDPSLRELVAPWFTGATLVIPDRATASDPGRIAEWLARSSVTVLQASPVLLQLVAAASPRAVRSLRLICSAGARLTAPAVEAARRLAPRAVVANCYGASETPQVVCLHTIEPGEPLTGPPPIGRPLAHATVRVEPTGPPGEGVLHVGAAACALRYVDRSPLLVHDADGRPWYDTGDVVRQGPGGELWFVGRRDRQVQVNGARVELEEVEAAAREVPGVAGADAVHVEDDLGTGSVRLTVTPGPGTMVDHGQLTAVLRDLLDPAVVPASVTEGGVPAPRPVTPAGTAPDRAEAVLAALRECATAALGHTGIDPTAGFFEAGFTSVTLMRFVAEASVRLEREISPVAAFRHPSLVALADHLSGDPDR